MMRIVRSTSSHASAGESNGTRETLRSGEIQAKGVVLPDDDGVSPNPARGELVSASLNQIGGQPPRRGEACHQQGSNGRLAPVGPVGVRAVGAHQKNYHVIWETRSSGRLLRQLPMGMHNRRRCLSRESEGLVVARKRGNARGAKEPCCMHAFINEERAA